MWKHINKGRGKEKKRSHCPQQIYNLMVDPYRNSEMEWAKVMEKIIPKIICGISQRGSWICVTFV